MLFFDVHFEVAQLREAGPAVFAGVSATRVRARVAQQVGAHAEGARAARAGVGPAGGVARAVAAQRGLPAEAAPARRAHARLAAAVRLRVDVQAGVGAEALVAQRALVAALARVQLRVLRQRGARAEVPPALRARVLAAARVRVRVLHVVEVTGRRAVLLTAGGALADLLVGLGFGGLRIRYISVADVTAVFGPIADIFLGRNGAVRGLARPLVRRRGRGLVL